MGARVIKVEPLAGDPARRTGLQNAKFLVGKESIALDLKSSEGRAILQQLIGGADALLHSFRRGVPERLGHDYETALALNPRLVYVYGGSYGSRGPENAARVPLHPERALRRWVRASGPRQSPRRRLVSGSRFRHCHRDRADARAVGA